METVVHCAVQNKTEIEMAGEDACKGLMSFPRHREEEERRNAISWTDQHLSVFSPPANYSEKNSTFSKKALAPPDVPLVFIWKPNPLIGGTTV